jgi:hypothetical protein
MRLVGTAETGTGFAAGERHVPGQSAAGGLLPARRAYPAALKALALPRLGGALHANADAIYQASVPANERRAAARLVRDACAAGSVDPLTLGSCSDIDVGFAADNYLARFRGAKGLDAVREGLARSITCPPSTAYALVRALLQAGICTTADALPTIASPLAACHLLGEKIKTPLLKHDVCGALAIDVVPETLGEGSPSLMLYREFGAPVCDLSSLHDRLSAAGRELVTKCLDSLCSRSGGVIGDVSWIGFDWAADQVGMCMDDLGLTTPEALDGLDDQAIEAVVEQYMSVDAQGFRSLCRAISAMSERIGDTTHRRASLPELLVACEAAGGLDARVASTIRAHQKRLGKASACLSETYFDYPPVCVVFCPAPLANEAVDLLNNDSGEAECHGHLPTGDGKALRASIQALSMCMRVLSELTSLSEEAG